MSDRQDLKADGGKTDPTLLDEGCPRAIAVITRVLDYGALKYEAHSWQKVPDAIQRYKKAERRHMRKRDQGEVLDEESGLLHLAHQAINTIFQLELLLKDLTPTGFEAFLKFKEPPTSHKGT